jgi:type VI protein secretion system component VasK
VTRLVILVLVVLVFVALWIIDTQALLELGAWYGWHHARVMSGIIGVLALGVVAFAAARRWRKPAKGGRQRATKRRNAPARRGKSARPSPRQRQAGKAARGRSRG